MDPSTLKALLQTAAKIIPAVGPQIDKWRGKPSKADRDILAQYVKRLDERRVFFRSYDLEVFDACISSLDEVRAFTDKTRATVSHPGAKAALGVILDSTRDVLDKWAGRGAGGGGGSGPWSWSSGRRSQTFFEDLGELRGIVRLMVQLLQQLDGRLVAPNLTPEDRHEET